ncbi:MAG: stage V sporulation protein D, partial [Firmicutes bacterium]|nr:stage V sporulation protein D [Bacillota bacterium]
MKTRTSPRIQQLNTLTSLRKRLLFVFIAVVLLFIALFGRLFYIQVIDGRRLWERAAEQWYRDLPLSAPRGVIYDANRTVLADNKDVYTVYARPKAITKPEKVAAALSSALGVDYAKLLGKINARVVSEITVARQIDPAVANALIKQGLEGVYFTLDSKRNYPEGNFLTQVLGFTNIDNKGQNGLEGYYDSYLTGRNGFAYTAADIKGVELPNNSTWYVPAIPGSDLTLSVDAQIQAFAAEAIMTAKEEFKAKSASMIVMDAKT